MANLFNSIKLTKPKKSVFDLTHDVKLSFNMGELIPVCCLETVPGDSFTISCESLVRFAPLISPVMHRLDLYIHYFFVPNRILWKDWEVWITGSSLEGADSGATPTYPFIQIQDVGLGNYTRLMDYFGVPLPSGANIEQISALPFAAYQKIYQDYYRDQNLIAEVFPQFGMNDGDQSVGPTADLTKLRIRAWEHDYFTSALPWAQKGSAVEIPLGTVELDHGNLPTPGVFRKASDYTTQAAAGAISANVAGGVPVDVTPSTLVYDPNGSLTVGATTINDLRRAYKLQEWLEKNARAGTRYNENILAHFGVKSSDQRLQRPEYITGTKSPVIISEILNTTGTSTLPQGNMAGHGVSVNSGGYGKYFCQEHGWIIGIMSVLPKTAYQQGIPKAFTKAATSNDRFEFFWPEFAHIGEQPVFENELYAFNSPTGYKDVFGYVPRYAEYKYMPSRVAGDFRTSLDFWHLGRIFSGPPNLAQDFVECVPDTRIFAVTGEDTQHMYAHVLNKIKAVRPMPKFGTPHF